MPAAGELRIAGNYCDGSAGQRKQQQNKGDIAGALFGSLNWIDRQVIGKEIKNQHHQGSQAAYMHGSPEQKVYFR
jgi:hypothetical protein